MEQSIFVLNLQFPGIELLQETGASLHVVGLPVVVPLFYCVTVFVDGNVSQGTLVGGEELGLSLVAQVGMVFVDVQRPPLLELALNWREVIHRVSLSHFLQFLYA